MIQLQLRRGTDAERGAITPASGEPVWTTDTNELFIGDGSTAGGVAVGGGGASDSFNTIDCPAGTDPVAESATDTLTLASGTTALTITGDSAADSVTFAVADAVAAGASGLLTGADQTKLNGIEAGADVTDAANVAAAGAVMEADYNANTILAATADDTPVALTVGEQTLVGRITAGAIAALSATQARTLLNVADGANAYVHPNHSGDVTSVADGAQTIAADAVTYAKMQNVAADNVLLGNIAGAGGPVAELSASDVRTMLNVEDGAKPKPTLSKGITVEAPTAAEDLSMFFTPVAITVTKIVAVLVGSATPSVTWTLRHSTDRSAAGNEVVTGGTATTSVSTGSVVTSFDDATIPADSFVWLETTAQSGTVGQVTVTAIYTED